VSAHFKRRCARRGAAPSGAVLHVNLILPAPLRRQGSRRAKPSHVLVSCQNVDGFRQIFSSPFEKLDHSEESPLDIFLSQSRKTAKIS